MDRGGDSSPLRLPPSSPLLCDPSATAEPVAAGDIPVATSRVKGRCTTSDITRPFGNCSLSLSLSLSLSSSLLGGSWMTVGSVDTRGNTSPVTSLTAGVDCLDTPFPPVAASITSDLYILSSTPAAVNSDDFVRGEPLVPLGMVGGDILVTSLVTCGSVLPGFVSSGCSPVPGLVASLVATLRRIFSAC